jgi:hypothetical protein
MILLTEDTALAEPEVEGKVLCVYHKTYSPPLGLWGSVEFSRFKERPREFLEGADALVFVGLNKAMTPGSRTEMVWEVLFNKTRGIQKVSVDTTLFVSEPWRAWFHFGLVGARYRDYTYSYIAESQYKAFLDGIRDDNPFGLDEVLKWSRGTVLSTYHHWFDLSVRVVETRESDREEYAKLKLDCFESQLPTKNILRRLASFAGDACPDRCVPAPHQLFRSRVHEIVATDLPIDRWLVSQLQEVAALTNGIAGACS